MDASKRRSNSCARHTAGELRVCTHCYTGYHWLPSLVEGLQRRYPAFKLHIAAEYTLDPVAALLDAKLDLAIMNDDSDDRRLRYRELFEDEHVAVVPPPAPLDVAAIRDGGGSCRRTPVSVLAFDRSQLHRAEGDAAGRRRAASGHYLQLDRGHHRDGQGRPRRERAAPGGRSRRPWRPRASKAIRITKNGVFRKWYAATLGDTAATPIMEEFIRLLIKQAPVRSGHPASAALRPSSSRLATRR